MQSQLTTSLAEAEQGGSEKCTTLPSLISFDLEQQGESTEGEQRRRSKEFWFTAIFAVFFFLIGFISLIVSFDWCLTGHKGWEQFFFIGIFLVIPGGYATFHIMGIFLQLPGFTYESVSNWES